jgi:hypothetical protein
MGFSLIEFPYRFKSLYKYEIKLNSYEDCKIVTDWGSSEVLMLIVYAGDRISGKITSENVIRNMNRTEYTEIAVSLYSKFTSFKILTSLLSRALIPSWTVLGLQT